MRQLLEQAGSAAVRVLKAQLVRDVAAIALIAGGAHVLSTQLGLYPRLEAFVQQRDGFGPMFMTGALAAAGLAVYGFLRSHTQVRQLGKRVMAEDQASRAAMHDQLTGLPNRRHLKGVLNWHLAQQGDARRMAVVAVNLDGFRMINDMHGQEVGDELLASVGQLLNMRAGVNGYAARLGSDDFAVVLLGCTEEQLLDWLPALLTAVETPFVLTNKTVEIGATLGVAIGPADGNDAETLLHRADVAMRRAKEKSRGWFAFFKAGMDERVHARATFEHDLWAAVRDDLIEPAYQPLVKLQDGQVMGYEILARWTHPERGAVPPDQFIPAAEGAALIGDMTLNLLRKACRETANWPGAPMISINVSPVLLQNAELPKQIFKVLAETSFAPNRLEIELTETALVSDFDAARAIFAALKSRGVKISIDNFGAGHTSLRQLRELPFDSLKIDRSFIQEMAADRGAAMMIRSIVALARNHQLGLVAEGVETEEQARAVGVLGCQTAQGHFFGKPMMADEMRSTLPRAAKRMLQAPAQAAG